MAAPAPQPVSFTQVASLPAGSPAPKPLQVVGELPTKTQVTALTAVSAANAAPAAADPPTKAEYDVLVTLANANKAKINQIITALKA